MRPILIPVGEEQRPDPANIRSVAPYVLFPDRRVVRCHRLCPSAGQQRVGPNQHPVLKAIVLQIAFFANLTFRDG